MPLIARDMEPGKSIGSGHAAYGTTRSLPNNSFCNESSQRKCCGLKPHVWHNEAKEVSVAEQTAATNQPPKMTSSALLGGDMPVELCSFVNVLESPSASDVIIQNVPA